MLVVWDRYTQADINKVETVQRRAARYVANNRRNRSSVSNIIQRLKWKPLADRRKDARLLLLLLHISGRPSLLKIIGRAPY